VPVVVLQAGDDRLVDAAATEAFFAGVGSEQKEIHLYEGLFHEIFNETEKNRVFLDLERWLDARVVARVAATG
jgi:lysophospholipase